MAYRTLQRVYAFSDTYGRSKNPFMQDDADALLSTDFRSFPLEPVKREFDIYGRQNVTGHILRLAFRLRDDVLENKYMQPAVKKQFAEGITGIFVNAAPRVSKENGEPFYVATAEGFRIVTTDLAGLSTIRHRIKTLHHLDNDKNPIYGNTEQFRSSYTAYLLHEDHGLDLVEDDVGLIPEYPADRWELSYVDRFGNLVTYCTDPETKWKQIQAQGKKEGEKLKLIIGNVSQTVYVGSSLRDAEPGSLVMYLNGDLDVIRKWEADEDSYTRLYKSSFFQFSKPSIGATLKIAD